MKVGYDNDQYYNKRNIINVIPGVRYVRLNDLNKIKRRLFLRVNKRLRRPIFDITDLGSQFADFGLNRVDLMHFFNVVSFGRTPWATTFETIAPRFQKVLSCHQGRDCDYSPAARDPRIKKALKAMSGNSCKTLIAMSECNLGLQRDFLQHFPEYRSEIEHKLTALHPPQPLFIENHESKRFPLDEPIRFMFVGAAFFRKGGGEILEAFQEARRTSYHDLKLIIVSSLAIDDYATKETKDDVARAKRFIAENSEWIEYHARLGNEQVIALMKSAHVGLLPTYADTYGYSVLEFQAAGCPVISTDVRALPEINNNAAGWVIEVPKNRFGEAIYTTPEDRAEISHAIKTGLARAIAEILENRNLIQRKANAAIQRIRNDHSPTEFARRLGEVYRQALQGT